MSYCTFAYPTCSLNQQLAQMAVPCFGYTCPVRLFPAGILSRSQTQKSSSKNFRDKIKSMEIHKKTGCKINNIAEMLNPLIRGWMNYFGKFNPSAMRGTLQCIERRVIKWAMCKYKNFRGRRRRAEKWLHTVRQREPKLFAHWSNLYSYC